MDFRKEIEALEVANFSGDGLAGLKAQKSLTISLLSSRADSMEIKDWTQLLATLSKVSLEIVRLEGLRREITAEDSAVMAEESALRNILGKGGTGL